MHRVIPPGDLPIAIGSLYYCQKEQSLLASCIREGARATSLDSAHLHTAGAPRHPLISRTPVVMVSKHMGMSAVDSSHVLILQVLLIGVDMSYFNAPLSMHRAMLSVKAKLY